jgi:hypothetical protein
MPPGGNGLPDYLHLVGEVADVRGLAEQADERSRESQVQVARVLGAADKSRAHADGIEQRLTLVTDCLRTDVTALEDHVAGLWDRIIALRVEDQRIVEKLGWLQAAIGAGIAALLLRGGV